MPVTCPPYGWKFDDGDLVQDKDEQIIVRKMVQMKKKGKSFGYICGVLNADTTLNRGKFWIPSTVMRILRREGA